MNLRVSRFVFLLVAVATGCLPQVGPPNDAGAPEGGGGGGGSMSASCTDGVMNGDESAIDCGGSCVACALNVACRSAIDCASGLCRQSLCATPSNPCGPAFSGCTQYVDLRDAGVANIRFPFQGNNRYSPDCLLVRYGQTVTFSGGDFSSHTLEQACGPVSGVIGASSGTSFSVTFDQGLGFYGYFCQQHGSSNGSGMAGSIEVVR